MTKKPTIKDIARIAQVSATAVSMALNGHPRIGAATRKRILQIARELRYQPNFVARSLVKRQSRTLGVIITSILNPFYPELAKGIEDAALGRGYNIILCSTNYDLRLEKHYIDMLRGKGADGIIFSSVEAADPNIRPLVRDQFPFILVNRRLYTRPLAAKIDYIVPDNRLGGYLAMRHLYRLGHRRIGIIAGSLTTSNAIERTEGARGFLAEHGLKPDLRLLIECHFSKDAAYRATRRLMALKSPPSAIFAENDFMALGVREALLDGGIRIPEDVALVGFDDIAVTALKGIELTTVSQKKYEMGSLAVGLLIDRIEKKGLSTVQQVTLEPELIIRNSCGFRLHGYCDDDLPD
jgi:LacI family transcriptional regulator